VSLYRPRLGIYQEGAQPIGSEALDTDQDFQMLATQVKFLSGEAFQYSDVEKVC